MTEVYRGTTTKQGQKGRKKRRRGEKKPRSEEVRIARKLKRGRKWGNDGKKERGAEEIRAG